MIMLIGIVEKNAIMQIDFALDAERGGMSPEQAIYQGCLIRFRPIMMTTMAALLGAVPIALGYGAGGEARQPLGLVVVGGLLFSQLVTLYLTPVFYTYMAQLQAWLQGSASRRRRTTCYQVVHQDHVCEMRDVGRVLRTRLEAGLKRPALHVTSQRALGGRPRLRSLIDWRATARLAVALAKAAALPLSLDGALYAFFTQPGCPAGITEASAFVVFIVKLCIPFFLPQRAHIANSGHINHSRRVRDAPRSHSWRSRSWVLARPRSACNTTAGQTDAAGGRGGGRGGRGGGQAIRVETAPLQHISIERRVDLSGTLVSPDQARVSSEVAGVIREVRVQLGSEVRVGDVLVRLEPRELALALERAESALRQVEAQLGHRPHPGQAAAARRADRVGAPDDGQPRRRARRVRTRAAAERPRSPDQVRPRHRRNPPEGHRGELRGRDRQRAQPQGEPAGSARVLRARAEEAERRRDQGAGQRLGRRAPRAAR